MKLAEKIESKRIVLKRPKPSPELAEEIFAAVQQSLASLQQWLPWATPQYALKDEVSFLEEYSENNWQKQIGFVYEIRRKSDSRFLGVIDIIKVDDNNKAVEIGYWLRDDAVGNGYMTEAVRALDQECFAAGCERVVIENDPLNKRSANVAKNAGYYFEGTMRHNRWVESKQAFADTNIWSKLKGE